MPCWHSLSAQQQQHHCMGFPPVRLWVLGCCQCRLCIGRQQHMQRAGGVRRVCKQQGCSHACREGHSLAWWCVSQL